MDGGAADVETRDRAQDLDRRAWRHATILGNWGGVWEIRVALTGVWGGGLNGFDREVADDCGVGQGADQA